MDDKTDRLLQIARRISSRAYNAWQTYLVNQYDEVYSEAMVAVTLADYGEAGTVKDIGYWFRGVELRAWGSLVGALRRDKIIPRPGKTLPNFYSLDGEYQGVYNDDRFGMIDDLDEIDFRLGVRKNDRRLTVARGIIKSKLDLAGVE